MSKIESYADDEGNSITIEEGADGVTVNAHIKTKASYTGGASASAARSYAKSHGLNRQ